MGDGTGPWTSSGARGAAVRKATVSLTPGEWKVKFDNQSWLFSAFKIEGGPVSVIPTAPPAPITTTVPTQEPTQAPTQAPTQKPTVVPTAVPTLDPNGIYDLNTDTSETNKVTLVQSSSNTTAEFKTLGEAIAKAKELNPTKEEERVVISLMPGVYREVNVLETPYVTIKKDDAAEHHNVKATWGVTDTNKTGTYLPDAKKEVILTFYYGIGYTYDSCNNVDKWGACFYAKSSAKDLIVEDIVFENSYNRYLADAELADNPKPLSGYKERKAGIDVASEAYNERSACLYTDAIRASYIGCKLLGAQDTFGLNGRAYLKDCYIEGRTDYICGLGTAYIEDTTLMFYGYSDSTKSGVITAMQGPAAGEDYGVLFNNCYIANTKSSTVNGSLGRPWRQPAAVVFTNSIFENNEKLIGATAWGGMSSNTPELAMFREWNSKYENGKAVDVSKRVEGTVLDEWTMLEHNPYNYTAKTDGWDPANVVATYKGVNDVLASATVVIPAGSDNKVTLPAAPEGYEFKWVSNSEYAVVNDDNTVTVIRPANGEAPIESTVILYVREKANSTIGNKKVIPVTISATTDVENVFTLSGTVSLKKASEVDVNATVKVYLGDALIKSTEVTIPKGQTSVAYEAKNIPVGTYDVKYDCTTEYYQITVPTDGKTTVTGAKGDTKTIDATVQALSPVHYDITSAPTAIGSGVTVTDNKDGSFLVKSTSGVKGGAYWNLVNNANEGLKTTQAMTVSYRLTITSAPFTNKDGVNGASIDVLTNTAKEFTGDVNSSKALRTLFGRWDQVNMIGPLAGGLSGSSNDGNQWLNPSNYKFDKAEKVGTAFDITVTVDFKNEVISATSKLVGSEETKSYTFDGFPSDIDRSNTSLAVYTGSKAASEYQISNIAVDYTAIVD